MSVEIKYGWTIMNDAAHTLKWAIDPCHKSFICTVFGSWMPEIVQTCANFGAVILF
jgi:hypothetical protein